MKLKRIVLSKKLLSGIIALCLAQPVAAATFDLSIKITANKTQVHSGNTVKFTITATNKGPDVGSIFIDPNAAVQGLSLGNYTNNCTYPNGFVGGGDGQYCELDMLAPGQSFSDTLPFIADPTAVDGWIVACASTLDSVETDDPVAGNDCAVKVVRILP